MVTIKKFGVLSVGVMWGILSAIAGLLVGLWMAGWFSILSGFTPAGTMFGEKYGPFEWIFSGLVIIIAPVFYGVFGFVGGIISAALYNLFARWTGGIKVELQQEATAEGSV